MLKEEPKEGLFKGIINKGFNIFSKAIGSSKVERRAPDSHDEEFNLQMEYYQRQFCKLRDLFECVHIIIESKKDHALNMSHISVEFS